MGTDEDQAPEVANEKGRPLIRGDMMSDMKQKPFIVDYISKKFQAERDGVTYLESIFTEEEIRKMAKVHEELEEVLKKLETSLVIETADSCQYGSHDLYVFRAGLGTILLNLEKAYNLIQGKDAKDEERESLKNEVAQEMEQENVDNS